MSGRRKYREGWSNWQRLFEEADIAADLSLGAKILKLAVAFEHVQQKFPERGAAPIRLREHRNEFESSYSIRWLISRRMAGRQLLKISTSRLRAGMVLDQVIKNGQGVLLVAKGQELTAVLSDRPELFAWSSASLGIEVDSRPPRLKP